MSLDVDIKNPDLEAVSLQLSTGAVIEKWTRYQFTSDFLTPTDHWSFAIGGEDYPADYFTIGDEVQLSIEGKVQSTGYIDSITITPDRGSGTELVISGRDKLGYVVDSHIDPALKFSADMTLGDMVEKVLGEYGFTVFNEDNAANRKVQQGVHSVKAVRSTKQLKSIKLHQTKPYPQEGAFSFLSRNVQRHGLWIWLSADGTEVIVGKPDFAQDTSYKFQRTRTGELNNILSGSVTYDGTDQPSLIYADGTGGGGDFAKAKLRGVIFNPVADTDVSAWKAKYPKVPEVKLTDKYTGAKLKSARARPLYLHDEEAKDQEMLDAFLRREMSMYMRRAITCHYELPGHIINGKPIAVDTIAEVRDDKAGFNSPMWIKSRTFTKSRAGTRTNVELIPLGSLSF